MSCSGKGKSVAPGDPWIINEDNYDSPTYQQANECDEGYLARAGNAEQELAGGPPEAGKIQNVSIPVGIDLTVTTKMEMTPGSPVVDHWSNGTSIPGLTFDTATGKFAGTISLEGKYQTTITAFAVDGSTIDSKGFQLLAQKSTGDDSIRFIHPLPGSVITSRCTASVDGTKIWNDPERKRPHKGIDLAFNGGKIGNVRAAASGEVIRAVSNLSARGYGNVVYIGHKNSAGKKICISVYGHLASVAVKVGQQVSAGDFIGVEGNTGHSKGAHLHFEIRSPEFASSLSTAAVYDPAAYISGSVTFDDKTGATTLASGGTVDPGVVTPAAVTYHDNGQNVAVTPAMVDNKCSGYIPEPGNPGPTNTATKVAPYDTNPVASGQCQIDGLSFTLKFEVGPWFNPNDPVTIQGLIDTQQNRKKCGYVVFSDRLGGTTKYGIAQKYNQGVDMATLNLAGFTNIAINKYWLPNSCNKFPYPMCVIHFDTIFWGGPGAGAPCLQAAFGTRSAAGAAAKATAMSTNDLKTAALVYINARQNYAVNKASKSKDAASVLAGWTNRHQALKAFCT